MGAFRNLMAAADSAPAAFFRAPSQVENVEIALVPFLKKAMDQGLKVISWGSCAAPEGCMMYLNPLSISRSAPSSSSAADQLPEGKDGVPIPSAPNTATNQNTSIAEAKKVLPNYPGVMPAVMIVGLVTFGSGLLNVAGVVMSIPLACFRSR